MSFPNRRAIARLLSAAVFAVSAPLSAQTATVYNNSTTDTFNSYIYSALGATQIGDVVQLGGTNRQLTDVSVQFFNAFERSGSFSAQLQLYAFGSSLGALLGTSSVSSVNIGSLGIVTVTFSGLDIVVPDQIAFAISVSNFVGDLDLGLNAFEPPTVGSSNDASLLLNTGSGLTTATAAPGQGNLYFVANATVVPEPSTTLLVAAGLIALTYAARRRRA